MAPVSGEHVGSVESREPVERKVEPIFPNNAEGCDA